MRWRSNRSTCKRKVKHRSKEGAYQALHRLRKAEYCEDPRALTVYRCDQCGNFHVGHRSAQMWK